MRISNYKTCIEKYSNSKSAERWDSENDAEREDMLSLFDFSLILEGDVLEWIMAKTWAENNISKKTELWDEIFFGKIDYDYGFFEFYFKEKKY